MLKQILFSGKVEVGISEINDGNMRFFGNGEESEIIKNQRKLSESIGLNNVARIRTIYGERQNFIEYAELTKENLAEYSINNFEKEIPVSDGLVTRETEVGILLPLADCLGIVVFDEVHKIVGLLHSGRQNVEQYGPKKFIEYLVRNFNSNPEKLKVYFSPHALSYQIFKFDNKLLSEVAKEQLVDAGVLLENIVDYKIDTINNANLPSHSSGDTTQRFAIVAKQR